MQCTGQKKEVKQAVVATADSPFSYYRTVTEYTSEHYKPLLVKLKDTSHLLLPNSSSYSLYDVNGIRLKFYSNINKYQRIIEDSGNYFGCFLLKKHLVLSTIKNHLFWATRGEVQGHLEIRCREIKEMISVGGVLVLLIELPDETREVVFLENEADDSDELDIYENDEDRKVNWSYNEFHRVGGDGNGSITKIFHPNGYTNKVLIITVHSGSTKCNIYNFQTRKSIFTFTIPESVCEIEQTAVIDVIGFGLVSGSILFYDIKKNKEIFTISNLLEDVTRMSFEFSGNFAVIILNNTMFIYNLVLRKSVSRKEGVFYGSFISSEVVLVTTKSSVDIYELDESEDNLRLITRREMVEGDIKGMKALSDREMVVWNSKNVFKMNIYRDEQGAFIKKVKEDSEEVKDVSVDGFIGVVSNRRIEVFGDELSKYGNQSINLNTCMKQQMELKAHANWIKLHREFCLVGQNSKITLLNVRSRRKVLVKELPWKALAGDFSSEKIVVMGESEVVEIRISGEEVRSEHGLQNSAGKTGNPPSVLIIGNILVLQKNSQIQIICDSFSHIIPAESYSIDRSIRFLVTVFEGKILIYDIPTFHILNTLTFSTPISQVLILDYLKFIAVLDTSGNIHLLSNKATFRNSATSTLPEKIIASSATIQASPQSKSLLSDLLLESLLARLNKTGSAEKDKDLLIKGLEKDEVPMLLSFLTEMIREEKKDLIKIIMLLKRVLLYRNAVIKKDDIKEIKERVEELWKEYESGYLETLGVVERVCTSSSY